MRRIHALFAALNIVASIAYGAQISAGTSGAQCLDIVDGDATAGTGVQTWACNGNIQQDWSFSNGQLRSLGMCLQVANGGSAQNGVQLTIGVCSSGSSSQQWNRSGSTWSMGTYCMDLTNGVLANGARPQLWTCYTGSPNQIWSFSASSTMTTLPPAVKTTTLVTMAKSSSTTTTSTSQRAGFAAVVATSTASKTSSSAVTTGTAVSVAANTAFCLDTIGSSTANGAGIGLSACSGSKTQSWTYKGGALSIIGSSKCIDVPSGSSVPGTLLQLWDCASGNTNQQWTRIGNVLVFQDTLCIDIPNGNIVAGQQLQIYTCAAGNSNQQFTWKVASNVIVSGISSQSKVRPIGRTWPGNSNLAGAQTLSWPASGFTASFSGSAEIAISLTLSGYPTFKVYLDNILVQSILSTADLLPITGLDKTKTHTIRLVKTNEADYGTATFNGFTIDSGGTFLASPAIPVRKIEVIGDSFSTGFGDLGTVPSCAAEPANEDSTSAYGPVTAALLGAEVSLVAANGWGMYSDYLGNTAHAIPVIYGDAVFGDPTKAWNFTAWRADVVVINLGVNDYYQAGNDDGSHFVTAYEAFLGTVRAAYGAATWILCTIPHVDADANVIDAAGLQNIIASRGDARIKYVDIQTSAYEPSTSTGVGCQQHPNVVAHAAIAQIMVTAIKNVTGW